MPKSQASPAAVLLVFWLGLMPLSAAERTSNAPSGTTPEIRIPVQELGYRPPGAFYLLSERTFSTLDFIDADHLLFTFHHSRLMQRERDAGAGDADQTIVALKLKLPQGSVESSTEWRMHDRSRYLWPIGAGRFLVRLRDSYQLTDGSLQLEPYINVSTPVHASEVSPDGRVLVIEHEYERHTADQHEVLRAQAQKFGEAPPNEDTQITLIDTATRKVLAKLHTELPVHMPITANGYVGVARDKAEDQWVVSFYSFEGKPIVLGKVASTCTPRENFVSPNALVIESCGPKTSDTYLDAWTTQGKKLWTGMREGHFVWPTFAYAASGQRFAVSLLHVTHTINLADSLNDEDVREQVVQVYDATTGALLFSTTASPVLTAGQNFALSADGERLAVLRKGAIEVYKVPATPVAEVPLARAAGKSGEAADRSGRHFQSR